MNKQCKFCVHSDVCAYKEYFEEAVELYKKVKYGSSKHPHSVCDISCPYVNWFDRFFANHIKATGKER